MRSTRQKYTQSDKIRYLVMVALFAAMSYVAMLLIHIKVSFLTLDVKDAVTTLCGLFFGPLSALIVSVLVALLELVTVSTTGAYGLIMNILGSVAFSVTVSLFYKYKKTLWGAIVGLLTGALVMTAVMVLANLFITPFYMGVEMATVKGMIPTLLLPFNLLKGIINVGVVLLLYKPLSRAMHRAGILKSEKKRPKELPADAGENIKKFPWRSVTVTALALVLIAGALVLIFTVLGGKFTFGT